MASIKNISVRDETVIRDIRFAVEYRWEEGKTHLNFLMPVPRSGPGSASVWPALPLQRSVIYDKVLEALSHRPNYPGKELAEEVIAEVWAWLEGISNQNFEMTPHFIAAA